jgi:HEPN domain-containing protein
MPPPHRSTRREQLAAAVRWLEWAAGDLATAVAYRDDPSVPFRNSAYFAQQAAEKAIKAVILLDNRAIDRVHDLEALARDVPGDFAVPATIDELARLSDLAVEARYPDEGDTVDADTAARAIATATRLFEAALAHFARRGIPTDEIRPQ